jgi:molybdopterin adenylyltransferase
MPIRVGVLTISDRCSRYEAVDESGPAIIAVLPTDEFVVEYTAIIPDDPKIISATLQRWVDDFDCDVVLTTGGTGFSARDVTPEATIRIIDRHASNISAFLMMESAKITPFAALSRGVAGIRNQTLIVNLPGSPKGAGEQARILKPLLSHAIALLRGAATDHPVDK